jgi:hypothetical protein
VKDNSVSFTSEQLVKQLLPCSSSCQSQEWKVFSLIIDLF